MGDVSEMKTSGENGDKKGEVEKRKKDREKTERKQIKYRKGRENELKTDTYSERKTHTQTGIETEERKPHKDYFFKGFGED